MIQKSQKINHKGIDQNEKQLYYLPQLNNILIRQINKIIQKFFRHLISIF
ncbi:hypothetical protein BSM4216_0960 [Bacillus smithii]|nr:hypothetical protein BSM4216_0960 [Bacillus smithii]